MVETPGTAPGSTTLIPRSVYRHSQGASPSCTAKHKCHKAGLQEGTCKACAGWQLWGAALLGVVLGEYKQAL